METKFNNISKSEVEIEISLTYDEIKADLDSAYSEEKKNISLPGFRKGKVPNHILKKMFGDAIEYQASEKIANKKFWEIVDQENLKPISAPQLTDLDFKPNEKLNFKIVYEIIPELELKDFKGLEISKPIFKVKDEDIDKQWQALLKTKAIYESAEIVENNNYRVKVNLQRVDENGNEIENSRSENILIDLSDEKVNPEIPANIINKKIGDNFDFSFTDEHSHGDHIHKETFNYKGEIIAIEAIKYPEITEDLVKSITNNKFSTEIDYKENLKMNMQEYYESESENIVINSLLTKVVENNYFEAPKGYIENVYKRLIENEKEKYKQYNMPFDENKIAEQIKSKAEWNAKWQIILDNLARIENIKVEESELEELAKQESEKTGISVQKLIKYYKDSNRDQMLLEDKVIKFLKDNAVIKDVNPEELKSNKENKD